MTRWIISSCIILFHIATYSQISSLTSSPYSMYGLGSTNFENTGITNSLGYSGVALPSELELNSLNPASLASIPQNSFFFDIGLKLQNTSNESSRSSSKERAFGFSNFSLGFPLNTKSAVALSLIPYSNVGYVFDGIRGQVAGSEEQYTSTIIGSGGLNKFCISYGRRIGNKLRLGSEVAFNFGNISQQENISFSNSLTRLDEVSHYEGFQISFGAQYDLRKNIIVGTSVKLPNYLKASKDRTLLNVTENGTTVLEDESNLFMRNFKLPLDISVGGRFVIKNFIINTDYRQIFWSKTDLTDNVGSYTDNSIFSIGTEYRRKYRANSNKSKLLRLRSGFSFNSGNLEIKNYKVSTSAFTLGAGIPIGSLNSNLNISYSYGTTGQVTNTLIREVQHKITINFSFEDLWFLKRKYD